MILKHQKLSLMTESEFFSSKEFQEGITSQIEKDTWGKGLPMYYMNENRQLVEHWADGTIIIKKQL